MTFTFPLILGGLVLVSIPVLLHLLMRQKPKTVLFPAFRFLVKKHRTNLTKLRLRHILLLALRMLLLAAIIFALAQPKIKDNPWSLPSDQAVAAVFVFDTSASMEYTVAASQTRLKDAQKRAVEMLRLLPENSEVVVLDTADSTPVGRGDWLSRDKAAERIGQLKLQSSSGPVSARVSTALELLARTATTQDDTQRGKRARVLCVFSDQTTASWDTRERKSLQALVNQVPPNFDRLVAVRSGIVELERLLTELEARLPTISQSFPQQALTNLLGQLSDRLYQVRAEEYPDAGTQALLSAVRGKQQELLGVLQQGSSTALDSKEYRDKLTTALANSLRNSSGFISFYVDVGIERPVDLALTELQLVRELPANGGEPLFRLRATAEATGEDSRPSLAWHLGGSSSERALEIKKGKREPVSFHLEPAQTKLGYHQVKVVANPPDQLPINNGRFLTFAFRPVLVLTEKNHEAEARTWARALESNNAGAAWYGCKVMTIAALGEPASGTFDKYAVVFMYGQADPSEKLWTSIAEYVGKGGGLGIIPAAEKEMKLEAYNDGKAAQEVLPARFEAIARADKAPGPDWEWSADIFKHPLLHPFQEWRQAKWDFVVNPRGARMYWKVEPRKDQSQVLVRYADGKGLAALVERTIDLKRGRPGRVLLFTSPPGWPQWNNYAENSFYLTLAWRSVGFLSGDDDRPALNFISSEGVPRVPVPIRGNAMAYKLYRDGAAPTAAFVAMVTVEAGQNEVRVPQATEPGNYTLRPSEEEAVTWFSVNLSAQESDLARVAKGEIETVLGPDSVVAIEARTDLREALRGHVSQPWELMPILMVALLVLLALENLLANKFYRREPTPSEE